MRLYMFFSVHEPLFAEIARTLRREHGLERVSGFVWGRDQANFLRRSGVEWGHLDVFTEWLKDLPAVSSRELSEIERRYAIPNLSMLVYTDRWLAYGDYDYITRLVAATFRRLEEAFERERPNLVYLESIEGMVSYAIYLVAQRRGIRCVVFDTGRIPRSTALMFEARQRWQDVDRLFEERRSRTLSPERRERAEAFIQDFHRERAARQNTMVDACRIPGLQLSELKRLGQLVHQYVQDPKNPTLQNPLRAIGQRLLRMFRDRSARALKLFEPPVAGEKYVLFPLHYQPEATTLVSAPFFVDQISLLEDLARAVPIGYRIYVKEHFGSFGRRPLSDYQRLRRLFNVRLLGPEEDSVALLRDASLLITITGTMGWEAILLEKPVITFGEVFYNTYPQVFQAGDVPKPRWPDVVRQALENFQPDREMLLRYIDAILDGTFHGTVSTHHPREVPSVLGAENVGNMARLLAAVAEGKSYLGGAEAPVHSGNGELR